MIIDCGNGDYRNVAIESDYIDIISERISPEFAKVISEWFEEADNEIEYLRNELDQLSREVVCLQEHLDNIDN